MHQLSRNVGRYSPRTRFAEVYLNTTGGPVHQGNYNGIYVIEEKIKGVVRTGWMWTNWNRNTSALPK